MSRALRDYTRVFPVGSLDDPPGKEGLANLTAKLMSAGATRSRSYKEVLEECFEMATRVEQQTDKELTVFWGSAHPDHTERFGRLFDECLVEPAFLEEDFRRVKDEQLSFLRVELRGNNDEELAKELLYERIFAGHPYRHHAAGTIRGLEAINREDVRAFWEAHFLAPRAKKTVPPPAALSGMRAALYEKPEARSVAISFGHPIPVTRGQADYPALLVAQAWLGQHRNGGRLFDQIREVRGLNYGDYAYLEYFPRGMYQFEPDPCLARQQQIFQVWIRPVVWEKSHFALRLALHEIEALRRNGMTEEDFERTRLFLRKYSKLLVKTNSLRERYAVDSQFYGTAEYTEYLETGFQELRLPDVQEAARKYLSTQDFQLVSVGPRMEEWGAVLRSGAATPIQYETGVPPEVLQEDQAVSARPWGDVRVEVRSYLEAFES
jgi:zinc protease